MSTFLDRRGFIRSAALAGLGSLVLPAMAAGNGVVAGRELSVGDGAPELIGDVSDWLNTEGKPLRLKGSDGLLKQGPVLIDFFEYTCVNCVRTLPYLKEWWKRYADAGLTIVGIHTPEFDFAKKPENVAAAVKEFGLTYPVVLDNRQRNWNAYGNVYWPRKYLLDARGRIAYDHAGEGGYGDTEAQIQKLLRARNPQIQLPALMEPVRGSDKPGAVCYPQTREIYCGYGRGNDYFGAANGPKRDQANGYSATGVEYEDGKYYPAGQWLVGRESIRHARTTTDPLEDLIVLPYRALEVNAVIRPESGAAFDLFVLQDGKPIPNEDRGEDIQYTPQGQSFVRVDSPRMYRLVKNRRWGRHELHMGTTSDGFGLYSFTFTSCTVGGTS